MKKNRYAVSSVFSNINNTKHTLTLEIVEAQNEMEAIGKFIMEKKTSDNHMIIKPCIEIIPEK